MTGRNQTLRSARKRVTFPSGSRSGPCDQADQSLGCIQQGLHHLAIGGANGGNGMCSGVLGRWIQKGPSKWMPQTIWRTRESCFAKIAH